MADILQAAKWMEEGKKVRRPHMDRDISLGQGGLGHGFDCTVIVIFVNGKRRLGQDWAPIGADDLLANDWEIDD